jgi:hypothetical protein
MRRIRHSTECRIRLGRSHLQLVNLRTGDTLVGTCAGSTA